MTTVITDSLSALFILLGSFSAAVPRMLGYYKTVSLEAVFFTFEARLLSLSRHRWDVFDGRM